MPIIITDEDVARLLSIPEAIEAMRVAFRDLAEGRAVNPPRLRYGIDTPIPESATSPIFMPARLRPIGSPACARARTSR
jgi:ornithine cyclodeaminase/alanine dehydrogenase-like protein (mu-crystallin family)